MNRLERFGEFMVEKGAIKREDLTRLLAAQRMVREKIGLIAVREGLIDEDQLTELLGEFLGIPLFKASVDSIEKGATQAIPKQLALKAGVLPVGTGSERRTAAGLLRPPAPGHAADHLAPDQAPDPPGPDQPEPAAQDAEHVLQPRFRHLHQAEHAGGGRRFRLCHRTLGKAHGPRHQHGGLGHPRGAGKGHPHRALPRRRHAAETEELPYDLANRLISRIKVMGGMDIAERRKPQDGSFAFVPQTLDLTIDGVNVRANILPVVNGEKAVLRLLPPHDEIIELDGLGMEPQMLDNFKKLLRTPYGIVLVTGPTGSGKSTTLYGSLQLLRGETSNITTIEDPVELTVRGVNQTQVDAGEKLSFADALRAILRQDPDIIMVGEIRDSETLRIALRAAVTGHLVLSTLHTNDAPSAFSRMIDMGAEPFLVSASVRAVLAQRLVRKVCAQCGEETMITSAEMRMLGLGGEPFPIRRGTGCAECHLGYRGRMGIYELLQMDTTLKDHVMAAATPETLRDVAVERQGFATLRQDGIAKLRAGLTTPKKSCA
jgi:type IV pilus assembly protein PilB